MQMRFDAHTFPREIALSSLDLSSMKVGTPTVISYIILTWLG